MKKIIVLFTLVMLLTLSSASLSGKIAEGPSQQVDDDGWYYLPSYPNYAPCGLPDFDQCQQNDWKSRFFIWSYCAPTSLANIFWWFDSKHSDPNGFPGDNIDNYPLVSNYDTMGDPDPGPYEDDHNFNNVNNVDTAAERREAGELIERLAWYANHNNRRKPFKFSFWGGTGLSDLKEGINMWLENVGLEDQYKIEGKSRPRFSYVCQKLKENSGVILVVKFSTFLPRLFPMFLGHYVSVAGVNQRDGYIALSDPYLNNQNPDPTPLEHNNASIVSHDVYRVEATPSHIVRASWWLPGYAFSGSYVVYALIISEVD